MRGWQAVCPEMSWFAIYKEIYKGTTIPRSRTSSRPLRPGQIQLQHQPQQQQPQQEQPGADDEMIDDFSSRFNGTGDGYPVVLEDYRSNDGLDDT